MSDWIYVVSGLPRSGTSLMMRMLDAGGVPVLTDGERTADEDNPRGYYELESVKRTKQSDAWLDGAEGKAVKVISKLLFDLPPARQYKVIFMRRHLDEVLASQKKMLDHRGEDDATEDQRMKELYVDHLAQVENWLRTSAHVDALYVNYGRLIGEARPQAERICRFLATERPLDLEAMVRAIEPQLYRNRAG